VVEHVDDIEMRVVVAKVLAAAAKAVLVAQHLLKLGAHLTYRTGLPAGAESRANKKLGGGEHAGEKRARKSGKM
jgi:hypothetical protein